MCVYTVHVHVYVHVRTLKFMFQYLQVHVHVYTCMYYIKFWQKGMVHIITHKVF